MLDLEFVGYAVVCLIVHMLIGSLWYGIFFGDAFQKLAFPNSTPREGPAKAMIATLVGAALTIMAVETLQVQLKINQIQDCIYLSVILLLIDSGMSLSHPMFEERPIALFVISQAYHFVSLVFMCCFFGAFYVDSLIVREQNPSLEWLQKF
eukprot:TRINITY_DN2973_c0_g2_i2.p3 TRINITY_DN2973_c0_g2~~TRINITY_DN2973_c0_g2_i2.p3  ORF type:complete len:151 (-),score=13.12 TRINITY_DN2973_c0_g2_i2:192-644(-)